MKTFIILALILISSRSFATRNVICIDDLSSDTPTAAQFRDIDTTNANVEIFIPKSETEGNTYTGQCLQDLNDNEISLACSVLTSAEITYKVKLFLSGQEKLKATVSRLSILSGLAPKPLDCEEN